VVGAEEGPMSVLQFINETPAQRAKHREIEIRYRRKGCRRHPKANFRVKDLERVFAHQYGRQLPDDDAGHDCIFIMANHLAHLDAAEPRIRIWVRRWAPWHTAAEMTALLAQVLPKPCKWKADKLGERLGLDDATRTHLKAWTIGAIDCKKTKRKSRRTKRAADRESARRLKAGARPHAKSLSQTKPWVKLGVSRSTFERRRRFDANDANSCAAYPTDIMQDTILRHGVPERPQGAHLWHALRPLNDSIPMLPREPKFIVVTASCCNVI
jgi:hypothetical protein